MAPPPSPGSRAFNSWPATVTLLIANFMNLMDVTIVNVALPVMQGRFGASASQIEWVAAGYTLMFALGLLPLGRLGDILGRKRLFLAGVTLFTATSTLCGLAPSIETLVLARFAQGAGAAVMLPQVLAIAQNLFPPQQRARAYALFGLSAGLAAVSGPLIGGLLIGADIYGSSWRPIFLINLPIGLVTLCFGARLIPDIKGDRTLGNDWIGIGAVATATFLLIFPLVEGRNFGWPWWFFAMMAAAVPMSIAFVRWEYAQDRRATPQLLPAALLGNWNFVLGSLMTLVFFSGLPALFLVLAIYLQTGHGLTPLQSALTTVPFPAGMLVASVVSGRLGQRWLRGRILFGMASLFVGMVLLRQFVASDGPVLDTALYRLPLAMAGVGLGTAIAPLFQAVLAGVPVRDAGSGSGALQAIQQLGAALGIAVISQMFFATLAAQLAAGTVPHAAYSIALSTALIFNLVSSFLVAAGAFALRLGPRPGAR
jgi:EmrB/QacA subfamily drug resistance transporter